MPARSGRFGVSLTPFGGGVLSLDAVYAIGSLSATPDPPAPAPPPPIDTAPPSGIENLPIPIVGPTPVPPGVMGEPAPLKAWEPATQFELARKHRLVARRG